MFFVLFSGVREGDLLRNVTTGLVIKQTNRVLELYFGCVAQGTSRGGAGYLRLRQGTNVPQVYPLRNRTTRLLAGSMFLTDICSKPAVESWISGGTAWRVHVVLATLLPFLLSLWMAAIFGKAWNGVSLLINNYNDNAGSVCCVCKTHPTQRFEECFMWGLLQSEVTNWIPQKKWKIGRYFANIEELFYD